MLRSEKNGVSRTHTNMLTTLIGHRNIETKTIIFWIFRIAVAAEFIGHGAFGIITKESWIPYFHLFGIDTATGFATMPMVGTIDISLGVLALVMPIRAMLVWMTFWGIFTATIRPLSGENWFELPERTYNFGIAFCFLYLAGFPTRLREWFTPIVPSKLPTLTKPKAHTLGIILRLIIVGFLIGHGGYGAIVHKEVQMKHFASIGLGANVVNPLLLVTIVGWMEIVLAVAVLIKPMYGLLGFVLAWKLFTEFLFPISGAPIFEFIERGGAYAAPLALIFVQAFYPPAGAPIWNLFRSRESI
jgi:hypothetical protein